MAILVFELAVLAVLGMVLSSVSPPAISATGPYDVVGYVTDNTGTPVEGIDVAVTIDETATTLHDTTGSDGFYQVTFQDAEWNDGNHITVIATSGGQQIEYGIVVELVGFTQIDVQFEFAIPEFGSVMGSMVAIAAVGVVVALFVWKRPR